MRRLMFIPTLLFVFSSCNDNPLPARDSALQDLGANVDTAPATPDATPETSTPTPDTSPAPSNYTDDGAKFLDSCRTMNHRCRPGGDPNCGACQFRIGYDANRCTKDAPCDNVFLLWAAMGCHGESVGDQFEAIVTMHPPWVVVCAQPLYPGEMLPASLGAPERENALVERLFTILRPTGRLGIWSGKNLLMGGCSQGASRYPSVAARYADDAQWMGSEKTAACLSDGVVSVVDQARFTAEKSTATNSCTQRHDRVVQAYTNPTPLPGHACSDSPG
ncbi:MAG: hypothetical protein JRH20_23955, partial [Deltaproteobacteria bacterium]|nr:hypothetical protein [Deltaproteobacteria bacterium]